MPCMVEVVKHFGELVSPSQEAFTLCLYENGYMNRVWMQNESGTSDTSNSGFVGASDGPDYLYLVRMRELTSINGGWSRSGMLKYNELYSKVKEVRGTMVPLVRTTKSTG
jgi:hypothetical protein